VAFFANYYPPSAAAEHLSGCPRAFEIKPTQLVGRRLTARARGCDCEISGAPNYACCLTFHCRADAHASMLRSRLKTSGELHTPRAFSRSGADSNSTALSGPVQNEPGECRGGRRFFTLPVAASVRANLQRRDYNLPSHTRVSHNRSMIIRFFALILAAGPANSVLLAQPSPEPSAISAPSQSPAAPMQFDSFMLVLLVRPPNAPDIPKPELDQLQEQHMANIRRLHAEGKLLKAGPTEDQSGRNVRGIFILTTDSVDKAREWVESDPLIKRGRLVAEYLKWYVEKGSIK
jgi:uncharacterized protein YciI